MGSSIQLPIAGGKSKKYQLTGAPIDTKTVSRNFNRVAFAAAHVVADPFADTAPSEKSAIDWGKTLEFRRYLNGLGFGIAEAMDTAQRGMGLDWPDALELITRTREELPDGLIFNGAGTDQLAATDAGSLDDVRGAYLEQVEAIQKAGGRIILMASRALAAHANSPDDYCDVYRDVLAACDEPVILHWLGDMFDPALGGYWGSSDFEAALETCLSIIGHDPGKIDGIKISLLDKAKEIAMRRRLPAGVKMYTGDDFNYPDLIAGDEEGFSHALLGIFDPIAPAAALAMSRLADGDLAGFHSVLSPTVPMSRTIFRAPTQYYKTGVVFLAWLNGFQHHFIMLNGAQSMRPLPYFTDIFKQADRCGLLRNPDLAIDRMRRFLALYGL